MKKIVCFTLILFLIPNLCSAGKILFQAKEFGPEIIRMEYDLFIADKLSIDNVQRQHIAEYQIVHIIVQNNSNEVLNVNPNYFTLISDKNRSYSYSSETHSLNKKLPYLAVQPIQSVDVYPGTMMDGFLVFEKKFENERPKKMFFKNRNKPIGFTVSQDTH